MKNTVLILGDVHYPYQNEKAVEWAIDLAFELRPKVIVQIGDALDQFSFSRFPKVIKRDPASELEEGRAGVEKMWSRLRRATDHKARCYQITGNHDSRILKLAVSKVPELASVIGASMKSLFTFDGVTTVHDEREELILDGVCYQHGHRSKLGDHCEYNRMNTVCGHSHRGGVYFSKAKDGIFWELNAGFLGDIESEAFSYSAQKKIHKCTLGVGVVDSMGPRFIPYDAG